MLFAVGPGTAIVYRYGGLDQSRFHDEDVYTYVCIYVCMRVYFGCKNKWREKSEFVCRSNFLIVIGVGHGASDSVPLQ